MHVLSMIPLQTIKNGILIGFVFPHGITDLFHAQSQQKIPQLLKINITTIVSCFYAYYLKQESIIQFAFLLSSIIHFRNDMPLITIKNIDPKWTQLLFSIVLTSSFGIIPTECFIAFMACIHTPNHYKISWSFLKENKIESVGYILGLGILLNKLSPDKMIFSKSMIAESTPLSVFVKSVVIGHIIYQEMHVFSESKKVLSYCRKILENIWFLWVITKIESLSVKRQ